MEVMVEFHYLGRVLCKHANMDGRVMEGAMKGRQVTDVLKSYGIRESMGINKGKGNCTILKLCCMHIKCGHQI